LVTRPFLSAYFCHCHPCQKRTGGAFSLTAVLREDAEKLGPHNSSVIALTLRVDTPCTYIYASAATNARSER
jgi:hypothetical protein